MKPFPFLQTRYWIAVFFAALALNAWAASYRYWNGGAGNGLWSDPANWTSNTKPASNDYAVLGNNCPDEPQNITLDESVWLERIVCAATDNRHYTISPVNDEVIRLHNDYFYHSHGGLTRTVNLTINADIEVTPSLLRIFGAGLTTLNGDIRPSILNVKTNTYIEPHTADGLLLRGSNTISQVMACDSTRVIFDNYFAAGSAIYRNYSGTNGTIMLRTNVYIPGNLGLDQPLAIGIEASEGRDVTLTVGLRLVKYSATAGSPITVLPRGLGCSGHLTIRLLGASAGATTGANFIDWILDEHCTLELANSSGAMYWGRSDDLGNSGWIVGAGNVVCDSAGGVSLYSTNAYTGGTVIRSGTMKMMGESRLPTNGLVTVDAAGTLDGNGFAQVLGGLSGNGIVKFSTTATPGAVTLTQSLTPGLSAGTLTLSGPGTLTLGEAAVSTFELGAAEAGNDQVVLAHAKGDLVLAGTLEIVDLGGMDSGDYTLFNLNGGTVSGAFDALTLPRYISATVEIVDGDVVLRAIKHRGTVFSVR